MSYKSLFIEQTENLLNELCTILPDNKNMELYKEKFYIVKKANSILIINSFIKYVLKHKKNILERNETFFLNDQIVKNEFAEGHYNYAVNLQNDWINISEENKNIIWKYFHVLILLAEKYIINNMS